MSKNIYIVRHCQAQGQPAESQLTKKGFKQAAELAVLFSNIQINRIISSPFLRAIQSVEPFSKEMNISIELDERLAERTLSSVNLPDWMDKLKATYEDMELKFEDGESSREAMDRIVTVVEEALESDDENIIIVTHGNIMSLLLKNYQESFGYEDWKSLRNPDVFLLKRDGETGAVTVERIHDSPYIVSRSN
ncbi:histidine phosphatase family protein [Sutcliffiella horikoshii]|uniref:Histidine phosphatase family protein n=1 Tax=Sutcliffiella horikoshii TaxID=79883 RepID=A0A5D4T367_9BACI|nr:histidine phosphatase family protein [Sutcliffiella horikoshii]TYS69351.1 histidine phosphatase family protein [Sutcliffiella horikoshii]